jgi:signal peptidase
MGVKSSSEDDRLNVFGYSYSVVASNSMEPTIKVGDIIISKDISLDEVKINDIVVFYSKTNEKFITHRVIEIIDSAKLVTKGDHPSASVDLDFVTTENYEGVVVNYGSYLGLGNVVLEYKNLAFGLIFMIFVLIIVNEVFSIIRVAKIEKQKSIDDARRKEYESLRQKMKEEIRTELEKDLNKDNV